ncbi:hypothetical protein TNCV_4495531 [Trichonephila clavipes]|nr:hypothetical protein TNCV_4495531 [Trichonephila clavipes]
MPIGGQFDKCWMEDWLSVRIQISDQAWSRMLIINERPHMTAISSILKTEACSNISQAKKVARFNETFPQAELQRLEQTESEAAHRAAETPEQSQARHQRHAEYLVSKQAAETPKLSVFSMQLTWRLREIQKPFKQLNLANALLLKGHNSDV